MFERNQFRWHFFENLDCHESAVRIKTQNLLIELYLANKILSMKNLFEDILTVVKEKDEHD